MDKNLQNIEDLFKKGLEGNEESPSEEVWNAIDQSLEKANSLKFKRKYYSLKRATAVLIVILALLSIYVLKNQSQKQLEKPKNENVATNSQLLEKDNKPKLNNKSTENIKKSPAENTLPKTKNTESKNIADAGVVITPKNASIEKHKLNNPIERSKSSTAIISNPSNISNKPVINSIPNKPAITKKENIAIEPANKSNKLSENEPNIRNLKEEDQVSFQSNKPLIAPAAVNFVPNEILTFNIIGNLKDVTKISPYTMPERITSNKATTIHFPKPPRFTAGIFYSPNIPFSHLRDEDHHFGNPYSSELEKKESGTYSYSFGLSVGYRLNYKWSLQSGVNFSTINMHIEPEKIYAERDNQGVVKYTINTSSGKGYILPSFSSNPRVGDSLFTQNIKHSLKYTAIPLAVKYNLTNGRFSANLLTGLSANILSTGKISTEVKRGNESEMDKTHDIHGLRTLYFSGLAGIGFDYNLSRNLSLTFSPTINFAIDPINKNVPVRSYPGTVNFQFGLKTNLF
jgi:hypothetical protein